jgi:hypothetical protein
LAEWTLKLNIGMEEKHPIQVLRDIGSM